MEYKNRETMIKMWSLWFGFGLVDVLEYNSKDFLCFFELFLKVGVFDFPLFRSLGISDDLFLKRLYIFDCGD